VKERDDVTEFRLGTSELSSLVTFFMSYFRNTLRRRIFTGFPHGMQHLEVLNLSSALLLDICSFSCLACCAFSR
jgi:hypothetical protein